MIALNPDEIARLRPGLVLIEPKEPPKETTGGLVYADRYSPYQSWGLVIGLGDDPNKAGFEPGDWVIFERGRGHEWQGTSDRTFVSVRIDDVMAVIQ